MSWFFKNILWNGVYHISAPSLFAAMQIQGILTVRLRIGDHPGWLMTFGNT